jgi:hypothetical protein
VRSRSFQAAGALDSSVEIGCGVRRPGDDVLALRVHQVLAVEALLAVAGSRVNATPVPESGPRFPNTIEHTETAVP